MNIKDYISSGIIESYVLGLATPDERLEFERLCKQYPELLAAREEFEIELEKKLQAETIDQPGEIKLELMNRIKQTSQNSKLINMQNRENAPRTGFLRTVAAASVILLLAAAYFAYDFYGKNKKLNDSVKSLQVKVDQMEEERKIMSDPNIAVVNLVGTTPAKASASIYWDSTSANVYLVVKNMPKLPSDKQYQLWSIINDQEGKMQPNSLGLFDIGDDQKVILKMSNVKKADAFAITIEKRGNTEGPTLEQLQSMGKIKL